MEKKPILTINTMIQTTTLLMMTKWTGEPIKKNQILTSGTLKYTLIKQRTKRHYANAETIRKMKQQRSLLE